MIGAKQRATAEANTVTRLRSIAFALALIFGVFVEVQAVTAQNANDVYATLKDRPLPQTPAQRDNECAWLRTELARVRSQAESGAATAAQYNSPALAQSIEAAANRALPQLQDRYAKIQCGGATAAPPQALVMRSQAAAPPQPAAVIAPTQAAAAPSPAAAMAPPAAAAAAPASVPLTPAVVPASQPCSVLTFDQCFAKCRELTDRTKAQCFDACRH